ncbi:MAG: thioredoxin fold domain-containing protein [Sulfuricurvum sp.]
MKKLLFLIVLFSSFLHAAPIQSDKEFQQAIKKMGNDDKLVLMIYTADDCPECAYMKQKVFHDKAVEPFLNRHFVVMEKNVHRSSLPDGYDYFGIPTMFFIDKAGVNKETLVGSKRPKPFLEALHGVWGKK